MKRVRRGSPVPAGSPDPLDAMRLIDELRKSNQSTRELSDSYQEHRRHTTRLVLDHAEQGGRACLLGAGNCLDLELPALTERFNEVHLVDIDDQALANAAQKEPPEVRARLILHGSVDLSGMLTKLARWARAEVTEAELLEHHRSTARELQTRLGTFDLVLSGSCITQMQLSVLQALGDQHRLFDAVRHILAVTHLHSLYELTVPGGRALLVTDVVSNHSYPELDRTAADANMLSVLSELITDQRMFYIARPGLFHLLQKQDPLLSRNTTLTPPLAAWLWQNGPGLSFLVYAMVLERRS